MTEHILSKTKRRTSLVVQWLDSMLLVQGTQVQSLVGELDPTSTTKDPVCCN